MQIGQAGRKAMRLKLIRQTAIESIRYPNSETGTEFE
jgi:hypothetical protein